MAPAAGDSVTRIRRLFGNGFHALASNGLSGLANVAIQLVVAAVLTPDAFGRFALGSATILFAVGGARMIIGQTDILRGDARRDSGPINAAYVVAGVALAAGAPISVLAAAEPDSTLCTIGLSTAVSSIFIVQDSARYRAFRERRAAVALLSDVVVVLAAIPGIFLLSVAAGDLANQAVLIWAACTAIGCIPPVVALRFYPSLPRRRWLHAHRDLVLPGGVEYLLQTGMPYLANWIIVLVGTYEALAGYRLVQLIFAAVSNIAVGLQAATLPKLIETDDAAQVRRRLHKQRLFLITLGGAAAAVLALAPSSAGTAIFGATWALAAVFIAPVALHGTTNALAVMNFAILRYTGYSRYLLVVRVWTVLLSTLGVIVGATVFGALGAAWSMAVVAFAAYVVRFSKERRTLAHWADRPQVPSRVDRSARP